MSSIYAISNEQQYKTSQTYQIQYFGTAISQQKLTYLMQSYGIYETGNIQTDIQKLHDAMYASYQTNSSQNMAAMAASNQPSQQIIPWAGLMKQIGLAATGNVQSDYAQFTQTIQTMKSLATDPKEKVYAEQLAIQAQSVFVATTAPQTKAPTVSGADILASINRAFILGNK